MQPPRDVSPVPRLRWSGLSDRGKVRANNEDSFLGMQFDAQEAHLLGKFGEASLENVDLAFAVSDGMGGAMAGEFASRITVEKITRLLPRAFLREEMNGGFFQHGRLGLRKNCLFCP